MSIEYRVIGRGPKKIVATEHMNFLAAWLEAMSFIGTGLDTLYIEVHDGDLVGRIDMHKLEVKA